MRQGPEKRGGLDAEQVGALLAMLSEPTPARHVRIVLAWHRSQGTPFDLAWASALRSVPRGDEDGQLSSWRQALRWARSSFQAAYERHEQPEPDRLAA